MKKTHQPWEFSPIPSVARLVLAGCASSWLGAASPPDRSLADLSLEELMNETVTSVSKREQKLSEAAAAITVLTNDDLRRSGATSIAESLRLVPGLNVATVNSHDWAISARGFNNVFSKNLLVLVDGRAVYSPLFAGVFWDLQQTMLEDVDRIEVIRGPGATVWGANAVNGVINIVTRSARETQGAFLYAGSGNVHELIAGAREGGRAGANTYYRVFGSYQHTDSDMLTNGQTANDAWWAKHGGFRFDHYPDANTQLTWQAEATDVTVNGQAVASHNLNTLARWTRQLGGRSNLELQAYYDHTYRDQSSQAEIRTDTFDVTAQYTDLHTYLGQWKNAVFPVMLGHENVGLVESTGSGGQTDFLGRELKSGDRVFARWGWCGQCYECRSLQQPRRCRNRSSYGGAAAPATVV